MISNFKFQISNSRRGFTLIELIVVMAVFLFVIGVAITIFISIVQHQKRVLAEQELLNQISYVEEYMSKALRMASADETGSCLSTASQDNTGYIYLLTHYTSSMFEGIKFINESDLDSKTGKSLCQEFFLENGVLKEKRGSNLPVALTSTSLKINYIKFAVNGSSGGADASICHNSASNQCGASVADNVQPKVTILLSVQIPNDAQEPERIIQTTVSERNINQ